MVTNHYSRLRLAPADGIAGQSEVLQRHREAGVSSTVDPVRALGIALTVSRVPLLALAIGLVVVGSVGVPLTITVALLVVLDILDGIVFEASPTVTRKAVRRRHICDAFGDRIVIHSLFAVAIALGHIDILTYAPVLAREMVLACVVLVPYFRSGVVLDANLPSKCATVLIAVMFVLGVNGIAINFLLLSLFAVCACLGTKEYAKAS